MKTIKDAAREYTISPFGSGSEPYREDIGGAFMAGAGFAQQWISVDDGLPPGIYCGKTISETVLVKDKDFKRVYTAQYDHEYNCWRTDMNNTGHLVFAHWRYIELL